MGRLLSGPTRAELIAAVRDARRIALRAGTGEHRFTPVWAVVVEGRIFVRSWSLKPRSWWRTLVVDPSGVLKVGNVEVPFRAARTRGARLLAAVDRAYLAKYDRPTEVPFARDMAGPKSRETTTELVPAAPATRPSPSTPATRPTDAARASARPPRSSRNRTRGRTRVGPRPGSR